MYSYEFKQTPNYTPGGQTQAFYGRPRTIEVIAQHHWGDPNAGYAHDGIVNHFMDPAVQVSAHYVVSQDRVTQMVQLDDTSWCTGNANPFSISIELDPRCENGGDTADAIYETVAQLIAREIYGRYGVLDLHPHNEYQQTECPGAVDLGRIQYRATQIHNELVNPAPPEWQQNLIQINPVKLTVLGTQAPIVNLNDLSVVKNLAQGTEIDFLGQTTVQGRTFLVSSYSFTNHMPNGIEANQVGVPATPQPPVPVPAPVDYHNIEDIPDGKYYAQVDTYLMDFKTGTQIKQFKRGDVFDIATATTFGGVRYLKTAYSSTKPADQGIPAADLALTPPSDTPIPPAPVQPSIDQRLSVLEKFMQLVKDLFAKIGIHFE